MSDSLIKILVLDRVEGEVALFESEDGTMIELPRALLTGEYQEGDVFSYDGLYLLPERDETEARAKRIRDKMDKLFSA